MTGKPNFPKGIILKNLENNLNKLLKVNAEGEVLLTSITDDGVNVDIAGNLQLNSGLEVDSIVGIISGGSETSLVTEAAIVDYVTKTISEVDLVTVPAAESPYSVDSLEIASGGIVWEVVIESDDGDYRMERLMVVTDGTTVQYTSQATLDIGNTSPVVLSAEIIGSKVHLLVTHDGSKDWNIYYKRGLNGDATITGGSGDPGGAIVTSTVREVVGLDSDGAYNIGAVVPEGSHISHIVINVGSAFSSGELIIGDDLDTDRLVKSDVVDLTSVDEIYSFKHHKYVNATQLKATLSSTAGSGSVDIIVFFGR